MIDFFEDDTFFYLVSELESGGTLSSYLAERKNIIKEERARDISHNIALAIDFMHDYNLIVGQLDMDSILMNEKSDLAVPRINKFSKARILFPGMSLKGVDAHAPVGKPFYWAPEICQDEAYDFKIDVWSFGVILYFLLTG